MASRVSLHDWMGEKKQTSKRGFDTKREALEWEREQLRKKESSLDMSLESFVELYMKDLKSRLRQTTVLTKEHIIKTKILPYFGKRKISDIAAKDVIAWQNELMGLTTPQPISKASTTN